MEHRWYPRLAIDSPVMVYQEQIGLVKAAVKNISADGVLVDMGRYALSKGAIIELVVATVERLQSRMLRLRALIVHADEGVAGLMFIGDRRHVSALWKNLKDRDAEEAFLTTDESRGAYETGEADRTVVYASQ
jgi:hypothetical protein